MSKPHNPGPIVMSGYLCKMKKKQRMLLSAWQKRWFSLQGHELRYYHSKSSTKASAVIELLDVESIKPFERGDNGVFSFVIKTSGRNYFLRAETLEDMRRWVRGLSEQQHLWQRKIEEREGSLSPSKRRPKHYHNDYNASKSSRDEKNSPNKKIPSSISEYPKSVNEPQIKVSGGDCRNTSQTISLSSSSSSKARHGGGNSSSNEESSADEIDQNDLDISISKASKNNWISRTSSSSSGRPSERFNSREFISNTHQKMQNIQIDYISDEKCCNDNWDD